jgi:hypothetical protein
VEGSGAGPYPGGFRRDLSELHAVTREQNALLVGAADQHKAVLAVQASCYGDRRRVELDVSLSGFLRRHHDVVVGQVDLVSRDGLVPAAHHQDLRISRARGIALATGAWGGHNAHGKGEAPDGLRALDAADLLGLQVTNAHVAVPHAQRQQAAVGVPRRRQRLAGDLVLKNLLLLRGPVAKVVVGTGGQQHSIRVVPHTLHGRSVVVLQQALAGALPNNNNFVSTTGRKSSSIEAPRHA